LIYFGIETIKLSLIFYFALLVVNAASYHNFEMKNVDILRKLVFHFDFIAFRNFKIYYFTNYCIRDFHL